MNRTAPTGTRARLIAPALLAATLLGACGGDSISGPAGESCGPPPYFTVLPVPEANLVFVPVLGGVGAPGHTLPTDHGSLNLNGEGITLRAPGDMAITQLRRVRYTGPDIPPGQEDYAIFFQVCRELSGWFGHVTALAPRFSPGTVDFRNCRSYSVSFADIETCEADDVNIRVFAGDDIAFGGPVIDMGMIDQRVTNFAIKPERNGGPSHAICMWDPFTPALRELLLSKLLDPVAPTRPASGEPRCGTMEVDVPGTAKGMWALPGTAPLDIDGTLYMALIDWPYQPQNELGLSLGPASLGSRVAVVERRTSGRVNRAFEQVARDGLIYCYGPALHYYTDSSWLLSLTSDSEIRIERIEHPAGPSPCEADPSTWSFGGGAVTMVR